MKQRIRLTESQLNRVVKESVKRVLKESTDNELYETVRDVVYNESLDMEDKFSFEEIVKKVVDIISHRKKLNYDFLWGGYQVRVHNSRSNSFVSFSSDENGTGLSEYCMTYLIHPPFLDDFDFSSSLRLWSSLSHQTCFHQSSFAASKNAHFTATISDTNVNMNPIISSLLSSFSKNANNFLIQH